MEEGGKMIRAVCLNPVIDRTYHINGFQPGKKYFHLKPDLSVGGKGINVAKVCRLCGEETAVYGFIAGSNGHLIQEQVEEAGIEHYLIPIDGNSRETINIIDLDKGAETEIVEQGPSICKKQNEILLGKLEEDLEREDIVICSGIQIDGAPEDIYSQINKLCKKSGALCFLDTNNITISELKEQKYDFYKPNALEVAELFQEKMLSQARLVQLVRELLQTEKQQILVSLGGEGGMLITKDKCLIANIPKVKVSSTIGSGDSTVAGFAVGVKRGWSQSECFRYAMACGVVNSLYTQVGIVDKKQVEEMKKCIEIIEWSGAKYDEYSKGIKESNMDFARNRRASF